MTAPVHDESGVLRALMVGTLRLDKDHVLHTLSKARIGQTGYFVLVARDGTIVVHPDLNLVAQHLDVLGATGDVIREALTRSSGTTLVGLDRAGKRSIFSFQTVALPDWVLVGIQPNEEALAALSGLSKRMLLAGVLFALLLIPVMWLVISRLLRPLDEVRGQMRAIKDGKPLDAHFHTHKWSAELRQMASEFADMVQARRDAEQALMQEKERAEVTLRSIGDAVITTDRSGAVASMNPLAERLTGWQQEEARGMPFAEIFVAEREDNGLHAEDVSALAMRENAIITLPYNTVLRAKSGQVIPVNDSAAPIHNAAGEPDGVVVVFRDVAIERATVQELNWRASHDAMTGLANRAAYEAALGRLFDSCQDGEQHAVLMMDLDQFKIVNDTSGHAAGDELLRRIAQLFADRARKADMVARLGGDEFAIIMYHCPGEKALRLAEELRRDVVGMRFVWQEQTYRVGVSVGIVAVDRTYGSAQDVQKAVDMACYMAKRDNRHICVHSRDDRQLETMRTEMHAVARIHTAIEENRLRLYAQAVMPISDRTVVGHHFEVLVRMVDENDNLIPPGAFLPAAERYGLMDQLDRWVIAHAAEACAKRFGPDNWHLLDTAAINLSPLTLRDESIGEYIIDQLHRYGVPLKCVCIEVTESAAVENLDMVRKLMNRLRAKGLRFALDDFGVGMTSLAQLRDLPVDILKIDGSFVSNIGKDRVNGSMVYAIQNIARLLSMKTVAECVESEEELAHLTALGVDYAQGYLLARPRPIESMLNDVVMQ
jgi:diguanylate cyclase (GGDEF)-like protein/PAS domain S-box-containing protein